MQSTAARRTIWSVSTFLSLVVASYAIFLIVTGFDFVPDKIADNSFFTPLALHIHIVASAITLLIGPWQFVRRLRERAPQVHRWLGRTYVVAVAVGGVCGAAIALTTTSGLFAGFGFLLLAIAWLFCTGMAVKRVRARDIDDHRRWMMRSFALTFAAVTLRLYIGIATGALQLDFETAYPFIAWLCWVPNLLLINLWIRRQLPRATRPIRVLVSSAR